MHRPNQDLQNLKFSCLYHFPFAHQWSPNLYLIFGPFRAFKALRVLKGPQSQIKFFTYFKLNASAVSRSTKPEIFMSLSLSVLSQSGPPKSVGSGGGSYTTLLSDNSLSELISVKESIFNTHCVNLYVMD